MKTIFSRLALSTVALGFVTSAFAASPAPLTTAGPVTRARVPLMFGPQIKVACKNPGSHQDVAKTPVITNDSAGIIKKGQVIRWSSSDGDKGSLKLETDLAPGSAVKALGKAGNGYTCSASFFGGPDLVVKQAMFNSQNNAQITIRNQGAHGTAAPSTATVEAVSCSGTVIARTTVKINELKPGQEHSVGTSLMRPSGKVYLRVVADAGKAVFEVNETNNVWDAFGTCVH